MPGDRRAEIEALVTHYAAGNGRTQYNIYLKRLAKYRHHVESVFAAHGLPREFACVAMIESAVDPSRVSHAGAAGMWQFIPSTARRYRLVVTDHVDQRFDPTLSTYAAAAYLRDLLLMFDGDFAPALGGYNGGEMMIASALTSGPEGQDFWDLDPHGTAGSPGRTIPYETYDYVARFFAVAMIYQNLEVFGFEEPPAEDEPFVLAEVTGAVDIASLSEDLGLDPVHLATMNPSLMRGETDEDLPTAIRLPARDVGDYVKLLRRHGRYRVSYVYRHKVTNYESLRAIALDYGVPEAMIAAVNDLPYGPRLDEGTIVEVPASTRSEKAGWAAERNRAWWEKRAER
ncbi:MAG: lytic transglycosylase domain-containing protein [Deltaproteobacteria bacterium]|nr:lytic transglycosylase domain-containing protein [Deltaproteobacteria bacterium]